MTPDNIINQWQSNEDWLKTSENKYRDEMRRIGIEARKIREEIGVSLREVARRMDVSAAFLSDLELGNRGWTKPTIEKRADAINQLKGDK